ncbi:Ca-activated chloride channel family protein [Neorhodopirellula lusitana]|uniref:Ca-activated chloride channel family protein n=1 Tax=Neorhodopirellula lusitana TaxID=445327 RepID=A0ABY1PQF3_9BACT|nr:VWA domain-containing protein [Neorhodopirellula lusitana]SMP42570.1 Ca-activated chloride channel family protein [Neorhodopirellula lusitana]
MSGLLSLPQFHLLRPWGLLLIPFAVGLWWWIRHRTRPGVELQGQVAPHLLRHLIIQPGKSTILTPVNVLLPVWLLGALAVAGPAWRRQPSPFADDQAQMMIVMRIADSMLTDDLPPSRLERCRVKLAELLVERGGAGTGLIAYNGSAHLVMPVTDDGDVINHMLQALDPTVMPSEGDALVAAIDLASKQLARQAVGGSVLVVTDSVTPTAIAALDSQERSGFPVQFYVPLRTDAALIASGVPIAAKTLSAPVQSVSSDDTDISHLVARADQTLVAANDSDATAWQDEGYFLVPFLLVAGLLWSRRGWSVGL